MRLSILILNFIFITGCSSYFKRKECEKINWFQHGYDIAMSGQRTNADMKLKECTEAEARVDWGQVDLGFKAGMSNYCKPETVFITGKKGQPFNSDLCDPSSEKLLSKRHREGVLVFCKPENAYSFGASGEKYNQICPSETEPAFLVEYKRGRKNYIKEKLLQMYEKKTGLQQKLSSARSRQSLSSSHLSMHEGRRPVTNVHELNSPAWTKAEDQKRAWEDERSRLQAEKNTADSTARRHQDAMDALDREIQELRSELVTLQ